MTNLIYSEWLKGKHTFSRKILFLFPLIPTLMAIILMSGSFSQVGAYNWWYMLFLPATVALMCSSVIQLDKRLNYFNTSVLPVSPKKIWLAKISTASLYLVLTNFFIFIFPALSGFIFGEQFSLLTGLCASLILSVTWLWQVPLSLFLTEKFNSSVTFLIIILANLLFSSQDFAGGKLWVIPFAIPARLMAAIIHVNPNGIPLATDSPLHQTSVILPGILITLALFLLGSYMTTSWFNKKEQSA